jgi:hypothetical protein
LEVGGVSLAGERMVLERIWLLNMIRTLTLVKLFVPIVEVFGFGVGVAHGEEWLCFVVDLLYSI